MTALAWDMCHGDHEKSLVLEGKAGAVGKGEGGAWEGQPWIPIAPDLALNSLVMGNSHSFPGEITSWFFKMT